MAWRSICLSVTLSLAAAIFNLGGRSPVVAAETSSGGAPGIPAPPQLAEKKRFFQKMADGLSESLPGRTVVDSGKILRVDDSGKKVLAELTFHQHQGVVSIEFLNVHAGYREIGLSKLLFAELLARYPDTGAIVSTLGDTNASLFRKGLKDGLSREEAIKKTPAYHVRALLGFAKTRPPEHSMDARSGIPFTVEWSHLPEVPAEFPDHRTPRARSAPACGGLFRKLIGRR